MEITQKTVQKIVDRAKISRYGLDETRMPDLSQYGEPHTFESLALCLINSYEAKYDITSILLATMEVMEDHYETKREKELDECEEATMARENRD